MKVSFDAQPLFDNGKTGVAYCEAGLVTAMTENYPNDEFVFEYFNAREREKKKQIIDEYLKNNCRKSSCDWFPPKIYRMMWPFIPVPYRLFFHNKPDVTHFFNFTIPPFVQGKKVVTIHDMVVMAFPETVRFKTKAVLKLTLKKTIKRADKIIAVSNFSKNEIIKYFSVPENKIEVVYNAVDRKIYNCDISSSDIDKAKAKYKIENDYFLYLGTLEPRKNIDKLIKGYAKFIRTHIDYPKLVVAGKKGWLYNSIFDTVKEQNVVNDVIFTDYLPAEEAPLLMRGAIAFCFPSLYEGFGMPPLEAMACGTPVLTSNCSSLPEVVGECAVTVNPLSIDEICSGLELLFSDEKLRKRLSEKGLKRASEFNWKSESDKLYNIYQELLNEKN